MSTIYVELVNASCALVRGYGSRELIIEVKGRAPVWAVRDRAWVVQPATARDVIAAAEMRGREVIVLHASSPSAAGRDDVAVLGGDTREYMPSSQPDPGRGLW